MNNRMIFLIGALVLFTGFSGMAGNRRANRLFELYKYSKAIPLYQKSLLVGSEQEKREATFRLADCYRLVNNVREACSWYTRGIEMYDPEPISFFYLGQALRSLGEYQEAEKNFLRYAELEPGDPRGEIMAGLCRDIRELEPLAPSVEIANASSLNSKFSDFAPVFFKDGILITSDRSTGLPDDYVYEWTNYGYLDLYFSKPTYYNDFWTSMEKPRRTSDVFNQTWHDGPVSFSSDFKTIFLTRTTKSKIKRDQNNFRTSLLNIFIGEMTDGKKVVYRPFPYNNEAFSVGHPTVSADGSKVIFSSDMPGGFGGTDLYISEKNGENWSTPRNLGPVVNSFGNEVFPFWQNDSTLYFSSDGHLGYGGLDLFVSHLKENQWSSPENMRAPLNSPSDDFGLVFRKGSTDGFFSSNRPGGMGADDIYAVRNYTPLPVGKKKGDEKEPTHQDEGGKWLASGGKACGYVKDKKTLQPLFSASVFVLDPRTRQVLVLKTDTEGFFQLPVDSSVLYVVKAMKKGYFDNCFNFRFPEINPGKCNSLPRELLLDSYEVNKRFVVENIYYDLDKWNIRADARPALDRLVWTMKNYPLAIELSSHTDSRASAEYNDELSQKRAEAAVRYITLRGVNAVRIEARGYGESQPVNRCTDGVPCSEAEHQANRRTEFKILDVQSDYYWGQLFDPSIFRDKETIPVQMLDPDFFKGCLLGDKSVVSTTNQNTSGLSAKMDSPSSKPVPAPVGLTSASPGEVDLDQGTEEISANGTFYTVQIYANRFPLEKNSKMFKGEERIFEKQIGEYYKYFAGTFPTYAAAAQKKRELSDKFSGCFVVGFLEGKVVPLAELKNILK